MAGRKESADRSLWYGKPKGSGFLVYSDIEHKFTEIFDSLRDGRYPSQDLEERPALPDLRSLMLEYAKYRVRKEFTQDQYVRKFYSLVPEIDKSLNLILEKVMNFGLITGRNYNSDDPCRYLESLRGLDLPEDIARMIESVSSAAAGLCTMKKDLVGFLSQRIVQIMPNTSAIAGEELAAELLFHAGSLENLAMMPASSIQVLGAEKALFRHFVSGTPPPKHGVLFHYRGMSSLKPRMRGKIARMLSGKIAIAARADLAGTRIDTDSMVASLKKAMGRK